MGRSPPRKEYDDSSYGPPGPANARLRGLVCGEGMALVVGDGGIAERVEVKRRGVVRLGDIERSPPESKLDWYGVCPCPKPECKKERSLNGAADDDDEGDAIPVKGDAGGVPGRVAVVGRLSARKPGKGSESVPVPVAEGIADVVVDEDVSSPSVWKES